MQCPTPQRPGQATGGTVRSGSKMHVARVCTACVRVSAICHKCAPSLGSWAASRRQRVSGRSFQGGHRNLWSMQCCSGHLELIFLCLARSWRDHGSGQQKIQAESGLCRAVGTLMRAIPRRVDGWEAALSWQQLIYRTSRHVAVARKWPRYFLNRLLSPRALPVLCLQLLFSR